MIDVDTSSPRRCRFAAACGPKARAFKMAWSVDDSVALEGEVA
jgi:hypothetical protein